jgi:hypothetical protein
MLTKSLRVRDADPEVVRLRKMARRALGEGALDDAKSLEFKASDLTRQNSATLDRADDQQRISFAAQYAEAGDIAKLAFDLPGAIDQYEQAVTELIEAPHADSRYATA